MQTIEKQLTVVLLTLSTLRSDDDSNFYLRNRDCWRSRTFNEKSLIGRNPMIIVKINDRYSRRDRIIYKTKFYVCCFFFCVPRQNKIINYLNSVCYIFFHRGWYIIIIIKICINYQFITDKLSPITHFRGYFSYLIRNA